MKPILVFQTDFTYKEGAVCAMYGVVKSVDRELEIIDGTHEIPQYDIWSASYRLAQSIIFWPTGTIFVSVVDPGVGTKRKACVAKTRNGYFIVTPDNGSLTHVEQLCGVEEVREIDEKINRLRGKNTEQTSVFHGRDLFAYCAARLASGVISFEQVGPSYSVEKIEKYNLKMPTIFEKKVFGYMEIGDPNFGNLWTNIPLEMFNSMGFQYGDNLIVSIRRGENLVFNQILPFYQSFGYVKKGDLLVYNNELMKISIAINQGNFSNLFQLGWGPEWSVEFEKSS